MNLIRVTFAVLLLFAVVFADPCSKGGEMRRQHNCASVRHTTADVCCWMMRDGTHGQLPYSCCGTGWSTHKCAQLIDDACEKHTDDL